MSTTEPTLRFSSRVNNYVLYRPGYPAEVMALLKSDCGLTPTSVLADIGSGTGLFTRMLLENGNRVFGVEPNAEMRIAGERYLASFSRFVSVAGTAEATTLANGSIDIVTAAQAAHWFDTQKARAELSRILKPGGSVVLVWNERRTDSTPFLRDYEALLLRYGSDYQKVRHERTTDAIETFFALAQFYEKTFRMVQELDYAELEGRLLSSSYTPQWGEPDYEPMILDLRRIFDRHQTNGRVIFEYDTRVFHGHITT